jgi:hypothetical protein
MRLFRWLSPRGRELAPLPRRATAPWRACWVLGCPDEAWVRVGLTTPGLRDTELCEVHDLAMEFNIENPEAAGLARSGADAVVMGSEASGWLVAGLLLVRPPAPAEASPETDPQGSDVQ